MTKEAKTEKIKTKKKKLKVTWTTDKIMSTSALFISVLSLVGLMYQSYLAREENKLIQMQQSASVLPYLHQWYSEFDNSFKLIVGNKGVGPAFIKEVKLVLDSTKTFDNTYDLFNDIFKSNKSLDTITFINNNLLSGFVLPANEEINLIEIQDNNSINAFKLVFNSRKILFKIVYEDAYGSQWLLSNLNEKNTPLLLSKD